MDICKEDNQTSASLDKNGSDDSSSDDDFLKELEAGVQSD